MQMKLKCVMSLLIISLIVIDIIKADIPVHCKKSQIVGKWNFLATKPIKKTLQELYKFSCGHSIPSSEKNAFEFNIAQNEFVEKFTIELKNTDEAILNKFIGSWTMIYDEGFDIKFNLKNKLKNDRSYFLMNKYQMNPDPNGPIKSKWVSNCYSTLIGWYHEDDKWGCLYGSKEGMNAKEITNGEAENKMNVVEGKMTARDDNEINVVNIPNLIVSKDLNQLEEIKNNLIAFLEAKVESSIKNKLESTFELGLESELNLGMTLSSSFKDHAKYVAKINSMSNMWTAENYKEFSDMTLLELNRFAGRRKVNKSQNKNTHTTSRSKFKFNNSNNLKTNKFLSTNNNVGGFPKNFSWVDYMSKARSQGDCGSCYAVATLSMLEARIRHFYPDLIKKYFKNKDELSLSLKHALQCSVYNQGCDGGYAYLVMKFFNEYEMLLKQCSNKLTPCEKSCKNKKLEKLNFTVKDYKYLGGSYGKCSEEVILNEVYRNGPIVVSIEPDYSFMFYSAGIYQSPNNNWMKQRLPKPEWQKVDHSVTLVGWGEEIVNGQNVKFWVLQNSWGSHWGQNGFMKFLRGVDHLGIESICEAAMPIVTEG